jgi:hypothetical protein
MGTTSLVRPFDLAEAIYNSWLTHPKGRWIQQSKLSNRVVTLAILLDVQACRLFRSVVEECRRCEGLNASILARSLFETVLAQRFILARRVRIIVEPRLDEKTGAPKMVAGKPDYMAKPSSKTALPSKKHWPSRDFRAGLYMAHTHFQFERAISAIEKYPGGKRRAKVLRKSMDSAEAAKHEAEIGPEWSHILRRKPHTYSGLSVADLARVLHKSLYSWYEAIYHFQSKAVHANDIMKNVDVSDGKTIKPNYFSTDQQVYEGLRCAIALMMINIL